MSRKKKKYHFIYKTTDTRNGNFYIGMHSTDNLNDGYVGSGKRLKNLIYKHGKEIFQLEILEFLPNRNLLKKREFEIVNSDLLLEKKCMNLRTGGEGGFNNNDHQLKCSRAAGLKHGERLKNDKEYRERYSKKISEANKRRFERGELKNFHFNRTGMKHKDETIQKMKEIKRGWGIGKKNSQYNTCWITKNNINKKIKKNELDFYLQENWSLGRQMEFEKINITSNKLNEIDVKRIKKLISEKKLSYSEIAREYKVAPQTIHKINKGETWKHIQ